MMSSPCVVRDISETGARLELAGDLALPDHFDLFIEKRNQTRPVHLKWRHGKEIGVAFEDAKPAAPPAPADTGLEDRVAKLESEMADLRGLLEKVAAAMAQKQ